MRNYNRGKEILAMMSRNIGVVMTADDVLAALRWPQTERVPVVSALSHMAHDSHVLDSPHRGAYVYTGKKPPTPVKPEKEIPAMFEYVGTMRDGSKLARDENGNLYKFDQI